MKLFAVHLVLLVFVATLSELFLQSHGNTLYLYTAREYTFSFRWIFINVFFNFKNGELVKSKYLKSMYIIHTKSYVLCL